MSIEKTQITLIRWSPKRLTADDITNLLQTYGWDNDSLLPEEDEEHPVEWEIKIEVARVGGAPLWP